MWLVDGEWVILSVMGCWGWGRCYSAESGLAELQLQQVEELFHEKTLQRDELFHQQSTSMHALLMVMYGDTKSRTWDTIHTTLRSIQKTLEKDTKKLTLDKTEFSTAVSEQQHTRGTLQTSLQHVLNGAGAGSGTEVTVELLTKTLKELDVLQLAVSALESQQRVKQGKTVPFPFPFLRRFPSSFRSPSLPLFGPFPFPPPHLYVLSRHH